jgi:transposase
MSSPKRFPPEMKDRACRLVADWRRERQRDTGGFAEIAEQLGVHPESLRGWFKQWQIDSGQAAGATTGEQRRIRELEAKVRELERSNAILRSASADSTGQRNAPAEGSDPAEASLH